MNRLRIPLTLFGVALAVTAVARKNDHLLAWAAIVVLMIVLALRVVDRIRARRAERQEDHSA
ncbi:MAG TPA: hypothetical protein VHW65_02435 [Gemmatimonadales bacterium]|jgi:uncharacterized protein (DUF58 family)|nr:hypothetical protein [Gemmatimonadales bacterium]